MYLSITNAVTAYLNKVLAYSTRMTGGLDMCAISITIILLHVLVTIHNANNYHQQPIFLGPPQSEKEATKQQHEN